LALKILSLKVASFFHFNLETFEKHLPLQKQVQLLSDLCSISSGRLVNLPLSLVHEVPLSAEGNKSALSFALTLYHRWLLRAHVLRGCIPKSSMYMMTTAEAQNNGGNSDEKFFAGIEPFTPTSIEFLNQIINDPEPFKMLTYDSFIPLEERTAKKYRGQKFEKVIIISKTELKAQIYYDLCAYNVFIKKYDVAKEMILLCRENLSKLKKEFSGRMNEIRFCTVTDDDLQGYLLACGICESMPVSLFKKLNQSLMNNHKDLEEILNEDNVKREIPFIQRKLVESDIERAQPENLKISALNTIRLVVCDENLLISDFTSARLHTKAQRSQFLKHFIQYSNEIHTKLEQDEIFKIKQYLLEYLIAHPTYLNEIKESKYLEQNELAKFVSEYVTKTPIKLTKISTTPDYLFPKNQNRNVLIGEIEKTLAETHHSKRIKECLVEIAKLHSSPQPIYKMYEHWYIPNEVRLTILSLKPGYLQDFSYILIGKSYQKLQKKDYFVAVNLWNDLKHELKRPSWSNDPVVIKLGKLIDWEKINMQIITRFDTFWPNKPVTMKDQWTGRFKPMIPGLFIETPRLEIVENCLIMLINLNDWESCMVAEPKHSPIVEICVTFANMMMEIQSDKNKNQMPRKRDFWDLILPIFSNQHQHPNSKRNQNDRRSNDSPARFLASSLNISIFKQFVEKLRDPLVISIFLSMLSKMHNLLKDDSNMELSIENFHLWPMSISNVNGYNIKSLAEILNYLLRQSLKLYPMNIPWVKLQGDLEFVSGNNESAMKYYVQSIIISTEYCTLPMQRPLIDENIIRKMIKCTSNLGCFLQSAVLCQFTEEIDYITAFKCIQEKSSNNQDAMDSYYSLIWDSTLLEYIINHHNKKMEHKRKLNATAFIRQLELNANNNEDVKQRAAAIRKTQFIRSLANQYM
jgi:integrator complex subunit 8